MSPLLRALSLALEALTALCLVACVLAAANSQEWWALAFAGLAFCAYEACSIMDEMRLDREATIARIQTLDAAWYAARPIPPRLLAALAAPVSSGSNLTQALKDRELRPIYSPKRVDRSRVEQAHARATNRLLRG